jgi:hypothetical protein
VHVVEILSVSVKSSALPNGSIGDEGNPANSANGFFVEPVFRHSVFCPAAKAMDDYIVKMGTALPADGTIM